MLNKKAGYPWRKKIGIKCNFCFKSKALNQLDEEHMLLVKLLLYLVDKIVDPELILIDAT